MDLHLHLFISRLCSVSDIKCLSPFTSQIRHHKNGRRKNPASATKKQRPANQWPKTPAKIADQEYMNSNAPKIQRHQIYTTQISLLCPLLPIEDAKMSIRRIPALCLSNSTRNVFLTSRSQFTPRRRSPSVPLARSFTSSDRKREQRANVGAIRDAAPKIVRGASKLYKDADAAVADLKSGSTILSAGFGLCGTAGISPSSSS